MFGIGRSRQDFSDSVFSDTDIRDLIKFCPPPSTALRASTSRSRLLRADVIRQRLEEILERETEAIAVDSLPRRLSVDHDGIRASDIDITGLLTSPDAQFIWPISAQRTAGEEVGSRIGEKFVVLENEAARRGISADVLLDLVNTHAGPGSDILVTAVNGTRYVSRVTLVESSRLHLVGALLRGQKHAQVVDLTAAFPDIPPDLLQYLATELARTDGIQGELTTSSGSLTFVSDSVLKSQNLEQEKRARQLVEEAIVQLRNVGWTEIFGSSDSERNELVKSIQGHSDMLEATPILTVSRSKETALLLTPDLLAKRQQVLADRATERAKDAWLHRQQDRQIDAILQSDLLIEKDGYGIVDAQILSSSSHQIRAQKAWSSAISGLRSKAEFELASITARELVPPASLYANGLKLLETKDDSLRLRNKEHVMTHLRTGVLKPILTRIRSEKLLPSRTASQELEKLATTLAEAKDCDDILAAVKRFQRKTKPSGNSVDTRDSENGSPDPAVRAKSPDTPVSASRSPKPGSRKPQGERTDLLCIKTGVMDEKVAAMDRMQRASDLLQHATWILLACLPVHDECLFVSAGKDASRMVKIYGALAPTVDDDGGAEAKHREWARRLETLREKVKKGDDEASAKSELKALTSEALAYWKRRTNTR